MPTGDVREEKAALRRRMRSALREFAATDACRSASAAIRGHLLHLLPEEMSLTGPGSVAAFAALPGEPDLLALVESLPGVTWTFPRVVGVDLAFHRIEQERDLIAASFGIREPADDRSTRLSIDEIAAFLVPGLAFDPLSGRRLGRGRGFYDRSLADARPGARFIGVGFDCQMTPVPVEAHDQLLHLIVTESGVHRAHAEV
ncbi:MAG: 5-formyltetrahydrofolate cyclo-ligase [Verrucomicrobiales bacterium]|nr:5-formyltetrahydrofolate cyclo-ligase [Verrucomicrobiales bacterium]